MVHVWRYLLPRVTEPVRDSWSVVFIDSTGIVSVISDHGHWSYWWSSTGTDDIRKFLLSCDEDYVARKLGGSHASIIDWELTAEAVQEHICRSRREGDLTKEEAREEYDRANQIQDEYTWMHFLDETEIPDAYEFGQRRREPGLDHWVTVSLPRLKELLLKDLKVVTEDSVGG